MRILILILLIIGTYTFGDTPELLRKEYASKLYIDILSGETIQNKQN